MKSKLRISDYKYTVILEKGIVICELVCDMNLSTHPAWVNIQKDMWSKRFPNVNYDGVFSVKAKARCNKLDVFDERKGKRIAESKAKIKALSIATRVWRMIADSLWKQAAQCESTADGCEYNMEHEINHLNSL